MTPLALALLRALEADVDGLTDAARRLHCVIQAEANHLQLLAETDLLRSFLKELDHAVAVVNAGEEAVARVDAELNVLSSVVSMAECLLPSEGLATETLRGLSVAIRDAAASPSYGDIRIAVRTGTNGDIRVVNASKLARENEGRVLADLNAEGYLLEGWPNFRSRLVEAIDSLSLQAQTLGLAAHLKMRRPLVVRRTLQV